MVSAMHVNKSLQLPKRRNSSVPTRLVIGKEVNPFTIVSKSWNVKVNVNE
jgi:hypothetical protein